MEAELPKRYKQVPQSKTKRYKIRMLAKKLSANFTREELFDKQVLQTLGRKLLQKLNLDEKFLGFAMVCIGNCVFGKGLEIIPFEKRLLLLPHCLRNRNRCLGKYNQIQFLCKSCGSCVLGKIKHKAERLGYTVLIAEGTPIVVRILAEADLDGIIGVACLDSLEKSFYKVQRGGIPAVAVPLLRDGCKDTCVDEKEVIELLLWQKLSAKRKESYAFDKLAKSIFQTALDFYPEVTNNVERIAKQYLMYGGKRIRPLLVVAIYSIISRAEEIPEYVYQVALAVEMFHKASLLHDDIEDDTELRYNKPTLHKRYGMPVALNTGDFLVGLGYNLIAKATKNLSSRKKLEILKILFRAHTAITIGQGNDLLWQEGLFKELTFEKVLEIYRLKTSEAFRASILIGALLANANRKTLELLDNFSSHFGLAFQIHDDLKELKYDKKSYSSLKELSKRYSSLVLATALEMLSPIEKKKFLAKFTKKSNYRDVDSILRLVDKTAAKRKARELLRKERKLCEELLAKVDDKSLAGLLKKLLRRTVQ
jgi:geranylgeranyl pyrophosphate synthase